MLIRNIWAVGRNYADHAKELGNSVPSEPMLFLKAGSCASINSTQIELPWWTNEVHHEVELALKINQAYKVSEAAVAIDLTERQIQQKAKQAGHPWTMAKSFSNACAVSAFFQVKNVNDLADLSLKLWINDELKQDGNTNQMIFNIPTLLEYIMDHFPVCPGDLVLTGTPSGVGPMQHDDTLRAEITGHISHRWKVTKETKPTSKADTP